ncbi:YdcF family protein [Lactococcus garvieae]
MIFSGGQGSDEQLAEALAMQKYAVEELGFPKERTLVEDQSKTTFENLKFSSQLIEKMEQKADEEFLFSLRTITFSVRLSLLLNKD